MPTEALRICPLCEATCGLRITVEDDGSIGKIRGDDEDVFSHGFLCPKGVALRELHEDPDRLRTPLVKDRATGEHREATWEEAWDRVAEGLTATRGAMGAYLGNPNAHNLAGLLYARAPLKALATRHIFSATTVDQAPKQMAAGEMLGTALSIAVPDIDRTDHLLILGANPMASNGSLWTVPDVRGRLRAVRERGGRIVVVDPRRTRTAQEADLWVPIRPGSDALLLFAMAHVLLTEGLADPGEHLGPLLNGLDDLEALVEPFTPEAAAGPTGIPAGTIRELARDLAAAPSAAVYGRIGTCTQRFGTVASWLIDVLNVLTGNLDREGGAMLPLPPTGSPNTAGPDGSGRGFRSSRWTTRVRGLPELFGELPVSALAEEILVAPSDADAGSELPQLRGMLTIAGNPLASTPDSGRLEEAFDQLEFVVSVDAYLNETTRHADVILPVPSPLERAHFDLVFPAFAVRNAARFSPPVLPPSPDVPPEHETLLRLAAIAAGVAPADVDVEALDAMVAVETARRSGAADPEALVAETAPRTGPERLVDLLLRTGPYALTLAEVEAAPHGLDLGALKPRLPQALRTPSGKIELAPATIVCDVPRVVQALGEDAADEAARGLVLVGRRHLRSNNSWMHNLPMLARGPQRCTAHLHPDDAAQRGVSDGQTVEVRSRVGAIRLPAELTQDIARGVVSIPHGWGHDATGTRMGVAAERPGANVNVLVDATQVDAPSGNAVLSGVPVEVAPVEVAPVEPVDAAVA